jgi:hypothetical protein
MGPAQRSLARGQARFVLAAELLADMRRLDEQMRESKKKLAAAVRAPGTELFGVGQVVAATVIGDAADVSGSPAGIARRLQRHRACPSR